MYIYIIFTIYSNHELTVTCSGGIPMDPSADAPTASRSCRPFGQRQRCFTKPGFSPGVL